VSSFSLLLEQFTKAVNNYRNANFVDNPAFVRSAVDARLLDKNFFGAVFYNNNKDTLRNLTFEACFPNGNFRSIVSFEELGLNLTLVLWMKLNLALHYNKRRLANTDNGEPSNPIGNFLKSIKKGLVKFRKILTQKSIIQWDPAASQSVTTFCQNANTAIPDGLILRSTLGIWNMNFLTNDLREFIYLGRNNFLRVGAIAAHT
jgi:hypothetical protein